MFMKSIAGALVASLILVAGCGGTNFAGQAKTNEKKKTTVVKDPTSGDAGAAPKSPLKSLSVLPAEANVPVGVSQVYKALGTDADGASHDVTTTCAWTSSTTEIALRNSAKTDVVSFTGVKAGQADIVCAIGAISGSGKITVVDGTPTLELVPPTAHIAVTERAVFEVDAVYPDHSRFDVTDKVTWTIADATVLKQPDGVPGAFDGLKGGQSDVTAQLQGASVAGKVTVDSVAPTSLTVTPPSGSGKATEHLTFTAKTNYPDGSSRDVTVESTWSVDSAIATIANAAGTNGVATLVSVGNSKVHAHFGTLDGSAELTVLPTPPTVIRVDVTPADNVVGLGQTLSLTATATFSDNSTQNVTATSAWHSTVPTISSVNSSGVVTGVSGGNVDIVASYANVSGTAHVRVPVNGGWSPFGGFSACSASCGTGTQTRTRTCNNPAPAFGGAACAGSDSESQACNTAPCFCSYDNIALTFIAKTGMPHINNNCDGHANIVYASPVVVVNLPTNAQNITGSFSRVQFDDVNPIIWMNNHPDAVFNKGNQFRGVPGECSGQAGNDFLRATGLYTPLSYLQPGQNLFGGQITDQYGVVATLKAWVKIEYNPATGPCPGAPVQQ